jgi:hypothetical protein
VGYAERQGKAAAMASQLQATRLADLRIAIDVQHLFKRFHTADRGTLYTLASGLHIYESQAALAYAAAAVSWLEARGAAVLTNHPTQNVLVGSYSSRNRAAVAWRANAYLACHVNAGGGNYASLEYMVGGPGQQLGALIGDALLRACPEVVSVRTPALSRGQRGSVCIEGFPGAGLILEPFFGDYARHQVLFGGPRLVAIGEAIGAGVAAWWERRRAVAG